MELGLKQTEVASLLGVHRGSVQLWEQGRGDQGVKSFPSIIRFLGYVPFVCDNAAKLSFLRRCAGMTQEELALLAGCNPTSIFRWENGLNANSSKLAAVITQAWKYLHEIGIAGIVKSHLREKEDSKKLL